MLRSRPPRRLIAELIQIGPRERDMLPRPRSPAATAHAAEHTTGAEQLFPERLIEQAVGEKVGGAVGHDQQIPNRTQQVHPDRDEHTLLIESVNAIADERGRVQQRERDEHGDQHDRDVLPAALLAQRLERLLLHGRV